MQIKSFKDIYMLPYLNFTVFWNLLHFWWQCCIITCLFTFNWTHFKRKLFTTKKLMNNIYVYISSDSHLHLYFEQLFMHRHL